MHSSGSSRAANGRLQVGAHTASAYAPGDVNGTVAFVSGPTDANPYFAGSPQTPYVTDLLNGAAIAGIVPGLSASAMLEGLEIPERAVVAIVFTIIDFPPLYYNTSNHTALLYLNLSGDALRNTTLGAGAPNHLVALKQFGWAKDSRFGGSGATNLLELPRDSVYATLTSGPLDDLANLSFACTRGTQNLSRHNESIFLNEVLFLELPAPEPSCPADQNGDRIVDDSDFVQFALMYEVFDCADPAMPEACPGDLNNDGDVDDSDFVLFAAAYDGLVCG